MGPDGNKKLSKRDGAKDILDYRDEGYLPAALMNFMATLGWNDGSEQEIFSVDELISKFDLSRVQRSGARFDQQRLTWMNGHYIRQLNPDELYEKIENFWSTAKDADTAYKKAVLALVQERLKFFSEIDSLTAFFFAKPKDKSVLDLYTHPQDKQLKKMDRTQMKQILNQTHQELTGGDFSRDDIQERLNSLLVKLETKPAVLFPLIRIALSGQVSSPEIFGTLAVLGKEESLARLQTAIALLDS
jgi:glutamyl/glutaminyl-tRNA synthetase